MANSNPTPSSSSSPSAPVQPDGYLSPAWTAPPSAWPTSYPSSMSHSTVPSRPHPQRQRRRSSSAASSSTSSSRSDESSSSWDSEREALEAQLQWEDSVRQLQALVNLVVVPWVSRYFGRKWAYWLFERYLDIGLGKRFWLGPLARYAPKAWR
ncbi:hypothetical protein JCM5296_003508 [Sporobolomyces johnsonii]